MTTPRYRAVPIGGCLAATIERRADRTVVLRSTEPLRAYPVRLTDRLEHWARVEPQRTFIAQRGGLPPGALRAGPPEGERAPPERPHGAWIHVTYAQMLDRARRIGQALLARGVSVERPVAILSDNDIEHLTLALGAMWAGVPYTPVSPAYSLVSKDHAKLRHILATTTPKLLFAAGPEYGAAIRAVVDGRSDVDVVLARGTLDGLATTSFAELADTTPGAAVDAAHAAVGPDTIVKFLFTSGSTKAPKGVVNTQRMLCANQQMLLQTFPFLADEPPVLVDWLPWNHTFGGNHNTGIVLNNGGTLYIDGGRPTPDGIAQTIANLREIAPTMYFNVPRGFEALAAAMETDDALRTRLFSRVRAFMFAGAGLAQPVWDQLDRLAERTLGERIPMFTGLGMTETAPSCLFTVRPAEVRSGHVGLPVPGVDVKLVPQGTEADAKIEIRFRGPNVMPGYWRAPELTADAFDDEGYYITGDAVKWIDAADAQKGLRFDGRIAEDFKLATGTFVSVGPLRARMIAEGNPCVQDVVLTGIDRAEVGALVFPRLDACRALVAGSGAGGDGGLAPDAPVRDVLAHAAVRDFFQRLVDRMWHLGTGSASRVARLQVLVDPPSIDRGEITDKGSINQRAVLTHRAALVAALYDAPGDDVLLPRR